MSETVSPETLAIRAKPKPVRRFNRNPLMSAGAIAILFVGGVAAYAFRDPAIGNAASAKELYNTSNKPMPDAFETLPASYNEVEQPSLLGPPLPGDLGTAMLASQEPIETRENPFQFVPVGPPLATRQAAPASAQTTTISDVRSASLFFIEPPSRSAQGTTTNPSPTVNPLDQLTALALSSNGQQPGVLSQANPDPNRQSRKEDFISADVDENVYNPFRVQAPVSPYQVMGGTVIPASLITGLNSDLPGQVVAQVTENVYDTPTGRHLLIPQGSRLLGRYDSVIAFGQSRTLIVCTRIIMPDGSSVTIENLPGVDLSGYAGLEDRVDNHTWQLFQAAILSSVLSVGAELGRDSNDDEILQALRDGGQRTLNQAGQRIVNRQLNVQPTITVRPGWRLRVIVNKDLILQPYGGTP